jgi:hypothetical protein
VDILRIRPILYKNSIGGFPIYKGFSYALEQLKHIHGFTHKELVENSEFTYSQPRDTDIHHLYCKYDPIIDIDFNIQYRDEKIRHLLENKPKISVIEKPGFEHCTDLWNNNHFAQYILGVLKNKRKTAGGFIWKYLE